MGNTETRRSLKNRPNNEYRMQNNHIFLKSSSDDIKKFTTSRNKKNLKKTYINPLSAKPTNGQTHSK